MPAPSLDRASGAKKPTYRFKDFVDQSQAEMLGNIGLKVPLESGETRH